MTPQPQVQRDAINMFTSHLSKEMKDDTDFGEYVAVAMNNISTEIAQQVFIVHAKSKYDLKYVHSIIIDKIKDKQSD